MCVWNFSENLWILRCVCKKNGHCILHIMKKELATIDKPFKYLSNVYYQLQ